MQQLKDILRNFLEEKNIYSRNMKYSKDLKIGHNLFWRWALISDPKKTPFKPSTNVG